MEGLHILAEASSSQIKFPRKGPTFALASHTTAPRKRRSIIFTEEDKRIVARSIADIAKSEGEGADFGALWKELALKHPRHSAHAWRTCYKEINKVDAENLAPKKLKAPFSIDDEEALIEFLAAGGPKPSLTWKDFAVQHPERRVEAWQMYSYRNRERLVDRIKMKRQELIADGADDSFVDDEAESSKTKARPRRSGVHFNETDRKILEEALGAIPSPRDARTLARLWNQLESEHPERSSQSWKKCYMKFRDDIGEGASRTSPRRPGRYGAAYTEAEEDALIIFLAGKNESDVSWGDFTKSNPGRTKEAWRQHWYGNRERLLRRAQALGLEVPEEGSIFSDSFRVGRGSISSNATEKLSIASSSTATLDNDSYSMAGSTSEDDEEPPDSLTQHHVFTLPKLQSISGPISNSYFDSTDTSPELHTPPPFFNISPRGGKRKADIVSASSPFVTIGGGGPLIVTGNADQPSDQASLNSAHPSTSTVREPPQKRARNSAYRDSSPHSGGDGGSVLTMDNIRTPGGDDTRTVMGSDFPLSDREQGALGTLIAHEGPNPPPGSLLRFAAKNPSRTLEEWLKYLGNNVVL